MGEVEWDVADHVLDGITAWMIQKTTSDRGGSVDYYSLEGALEAGDTDLAPTLVLKR